MPPRSRRHDREDEIELLHRARDGDVEQAALFFLAGDDQLARALFVDHRRVLRRAFEQRQRFVHAVGRRCG